MKLNLKERCNENTTWDFWVFNKRISPTNIVSYKDRLKWKLILGKYALFTTKKCYNHEGEKVIDKLVKTERSSHNFKHTLLFNFFFLKN